MSAETYQDLQKHYAHNVVVAQYTDETNEAAAYSIECNDCDEALLTYEREASK
jgi:hypothetical protein